MTQKIIYTPEEANEKLANGDAVLIDVRDAEDYEAGHIPGAVNIPEIFTTLSMTRRIHTISAIPPVKKAVKIILTKNLTLRKELHRETVSTLSQRRKILHLAGTARG